MALLAAYMVNKAEGEVWKTTCKTGYFRISGLKACSPTRLIRRDSQLSWKTTNRAWQWNRLLLRH